jgi:outer membrane immunogenic protein
MKKFWLGIVGLVALGMPAPASSADLPARPYQAPPPVFAPPYDWTGFYMGANGGWGRAHACWDLVNLTQATALVDGCHDGSGGIIGGQLGYRWQIGNWVFGLEAQGDWANLSGSRVSVLNPLVSETAKVNALGLFTGQVGFEWNAALLYLKGGVAATSNRFDVSTLTGVGLASAGSTRWGSSLGIGFEYGFTPNWSVGVEYDHLFMGTNNNSFSVTNPIIAGALNRISEDVDMVTLRATYHFGGYRYNY